jgi:hypothetical protein
MLAANNDFPTLWVTGMSREGLYEHRASGALIKGREIVHKLHQQLSTAELLNRGHCSAAAATIRLDREHRGVSAAFFNGSFVPFVALRV